MNGPQGLLHIVQLQVEDQDLPHFCKCYRNVLVDELPLKSESLEGTPNLSSDTWDCAHLCFWGSVSVIVQFVMLV